MAKMNWSKARRSGAVLGGRYGEVSASSLVRKERRRALDKPAGAIWPAVVTVGGNADGTLKVLTFKSRAEADAAGSPWVGR